MSVWASNAAVRWIHTRLSILYAQSITGNAVPWGTATNTWVKSLKHLQKPVGILLQDEVFVGRQRLNNNQHLKFNLYKTQWDNGVQSCQHTTVVPWNNFPFLLLLLAQFLGIQTHKLSWPVSLRSSISASWFENSHTEEFISSSRSSPIRKFLMSCTVMPIRWSVIRSCAKL